MKKFFPIVLLFCTVSTNAQRLNSLGSHSYSKLAELKNAAQQARSVADAAHKNAAVAHKNAAAAATAERNAAAAEAHTNAATEHNKAVMENGTQAAQESAATNATTESAAALLLKPDAAAKAADEVAEASDRAAQAAFQALLAAEQQNEHLIEIQGLGNIASSQNGSSLSPSASVYAKILFIRNNKNLKFYLGYNLGQEMDSTGIDSVKLGNLFLPDRSKAGFTGRVEYNILSWWKQLTGPKVEGDYIFNTELSPFVEYNYNKINIRNAIEDSSKIQTSSWIFGINLSHSITTKDDNTFGVQVSPYIKAVNVTAGTQDTYNSIFTSTLKGVAPPGKLSFAGITVGLQINRFLFSFDYQSLLTKTVEKTPLHGGVFTLRATVIGDLIKL